MKLKKSFITYSYESDYVIVDCSNKFSGVVHGNMSAAYIIDCLKEETTIEEIVNKMLQEYDVSEEVARKGIEKIVSKLRSIDAIDD